jgi:GNAT superfamily N-acetyltransferase
VSVSVRLARDADVDQMSAVLTASITELCAADHHDDPAIIANWTRNKSPDGVRKMLDNSSVTMLVAERDGMVAAVGCVNARNEIGLNYVSPAHRFSGVSKALLEAMEEALRAVGAEVATVTSTATAYRFYRSAGWEDAGPPETGHSVMGYPMRKALKDE